MAQVPGWSDDELEQRAAELQSLIQKAWRAVAMMIAAAISGKPIVTAADADEVVPSWEDVVEKQIIGYITKTYLDAAGYIAEAAPTPDVPLVGDDLVQVFVDESRNRLKGIGDDVWQVVKEQITFGINEGESVKEIAERIKNVTGVSDGRAMTIARTEVHAAHEAGSYDQALYVDPNGTKTWLATEDDRTRQTHKLADGQTVPIGQTFTVGGSSLRYPGDPLGEPGEIINCRCSTAYEFADIVDTEATVGEEVLSASTQTVGWDIIEIVSSDEVMSNDEQPEGSWLVPMPAVVAAGKKWNPKNHPRGADGKFIKKGGLVDFLKSSKPTIPILNSAIADLDADDWANLTLEQKDKIGNAVDSLPNGSTLKSTLSNKLTDIAFAGAVKKAQAAKAAKAAKTAKTKTTSGLSPKAQQLLNAQDHLEVWDTVNDMSYSDWSTLSAKQKYDLLVQLNDAMPDGYHDGDMDASPDWELTSALGNVKNWAHQDANNGIKPYDGDPDVSTSLSPATPTPVPTATTADDSGWQVNYANNVVLKVPAIIVGDKEALDFLPANFAHDMVDQNVWDQLPSAAKQKIADVVGKSLNTKAQNKLAKFQANDSDKSSASSVATVSTTALTPDMPETHNSVPTPPVTPTGIPQPPKKTTIAGLKGYPGEPAKVTTGVIWGKHPAGTTILETDDGTERVWYDGKKYHEQSLSLDGTWKSVTEWTKKDAYASLKNDTHWVIPGKTADVPKQAGAPEVESTPDVTPSAPSTPSVVTPSKVKPPDEQLISGDLISLKGLKKYTDQKIDGKTIAWNDNGDIIAWSEKDQRYIVYPDGIPLLQLDTIKTLRTKGAGWQINSADISDDEKKLLEAAPYDGPLIPDSVFSTPTATPMIPAKKPLSDDEKSFYLDEASVPGNLTKGEAVTLANSLSSNDAQSLTSDQFEQITVQLGAGVSGNFNGAKDAWAHWVAITTPTPTTLTPTPTPTPTPNSASPSPLNVHDPIDTEDKWKQFVAANKSTPSYKVVAYTQDGSLLLQKNDDGDWEILDDFGDVSSSYSDWQLEDGQLLEEFGTWAVSDTGPLTIPDNIPGLDVDDPPFDPDAAPGPDDQIVNWGIFTAMLDNAPYGTDVAQSWDDSYTLKHGAIPGTWELHNNETGKITVYNSAEINSGVLDAHGNWFDAPTATPTPSPAVPTPAAPAPAVTPLNITKWTKDQWKLQLKTANVGYWSKPEAIWEQIKAIQAKHPDPNNPGNSQVSPLDIIKALDSTLKTQKPNPFEQKMTKWAASAKGSAVMAKDGVWTLGDVGAPTPSAPSRLSGSLTSDNVWNALNNAKNGDILVKGVNVDTGQEVQMMVSAPIGYDKYIKVEKKYSDGTWDYDYGLFDEIALTTALTSEKYEWSWNTTSPGGGATPNTFTAPTPAATPTPITPANIATIVGTDDISHLGDAQKQSIYDDFKKQPSTYLSDAPSGIYLALKQIASDNGLSLAQALAIIDDVGAKKVSTTNQHLFTKKITDWMQTPKGAATAMGLPIPKPPTPQFSPGVSVANVMPESESNKLTYNTIGVDQTYTIWDDVIKKSSQWTPAQRAGLRAYTGGIYYGINAYLWGEYDEISPSNEKAMKNAQLGMRPIDRPILLHRGTGFNGIGNATNHEDLMKMVGTTWKSDGFNSTSVGGTAAFGGKPVIVEVEAPPGTPMAWVKSISNFPNENEMLLAAGLTYKFLSVKKSGGKSIVRVRVVPVEETA